MSASRHVPAGRSFVPPGWTPSRAMADDAAMVRRLARVAMLLAAAALWNCKSMPAGPSPSPGPSNGDASVRVLFIGNSLTDANNLPAMVESLSNHESATRTSTASVVFGGFSLEDHWNEGSAL